MNNLSPGFLALLFFLGVAIFLVKKDELIVPIIIAMCFLPADKSVQLFGLDFQAVRIMSLLAFCRIDFSTKHINLKDNPIDILFLSYNFVGALIYIVQSSNHLGAFVYKSGTLIDSIILYIVFRYTIQRKEQLFLIVKAISICVIILLPFIIFEYFSATNLFSILGRSAVAFRDGEVRAAGTFSHSILLGSFAVSILPVIWANYRISKSLFHAFATLCCLFFIFACSSSGPIVVLAGVIFFLSFFNLKQYSSSLSWCVLVLAVIIHIIREAPLWHFIFVRISIKDSSTGYHRYMLTEAAIKEFWNWWLLGYGDLAPQWHLKYWPWTHAHFTDITNHYILEGIRGGFFTMLIFVILCYLVIKTLGTFSITQTDRNEQWLWWGFTVMMISHCITFLSVAYFGQITMLLYLTIAVAAYAHDESNKIKANDSSSHLKTPRKSYPLRNPRLSRK
ncbi:MAG: hypothetical protein WBB19_00115 [Desulforhopalus sp.]